MGATAAGGSSGCASLAAGNQEMDNRLDIIAAGGELPADVARLLDDIGFAVIPGAIALTRLPTLRAAYDRAVASADPADVGSGRTTTRVWDFVNRGPEFDEIYVHPALLEACRHVLGVPFHLST